MMNKSIIKDPSKSMLKRGGNESSIRKSVVCFKEWTFIIKILENNKKFYNKSYLLIYNSL